MERRETLKWSARICTFERTPFDVTFEAQH
jgi:hypothetical protein